MLGSLDVTFLAASVLPWHCGRVTQNCEHKFEEVAQDPRFRFHGHTPLVGRSQPTASNSVNISYLRSNYDAVILSYGAVLDRDLGGLPGEKELGHILPARSVVNWYNSYPLPSRSTPIEDEFVDLSKIEHVTILGQGNVALDIARILLSDIDTLSKTDISSHALENLSQSAVKRVEIVGRRGPLQMPCTTKELRELLALKHVNFDTSEVLLNESLQLLHRPGVLEHLHNARLRKRLIEVMSKALGTPQSPASRSWGFTFLRSPLAFLSHSYGSLDVPSAKPPVVRSIEWAINQLHHPSPTEVRPHVDFSTSKAIPSDPLHRLTTSTDLVIKSLGYRSQAIPGIPYDALHNAVKHLDGRVIDNDGQIVSIITFYPIHDMKTLSISYLRSPDFTSRAGSQEEPMASLPTRCTTHTLRSINSPRTPPMVSLLILIVTSRCIVKRKRT